ncbi:patatin-like phospholipase family protein [Fulvivirgaceae bacterium PWU5]|uniref:Patatin-like phospholipase family protein n=1 Tax=Dawidia cretensis TaxID=2782350 RepID=A0AAP2GUL6_9BACT|nr:patatin-like phospholipase family protein [Dawidia cretensis]MBT1709708.1 patatin-like phospholipase family protein [Dawidia cretensis]
MKRFLFVLLTLSGTSSYVFGQYTNLVFEGAGIRGVAYAGVIQELEHRNLLVNVQRVGGTSAGAIAAMTLSLGYTGKEIEDIIYNLKLQRFNDGKFFFIGGMSRLSHRYGWYRGKAFTRWLEEIIAAKTGDANITFGQLHDRRFRDLYVTGTSLNHQKLLVFSHEHYPDMKVKDAVRISMSIPLYFEAVCIDSVGRVVDHRQATTRDDIMVDGGFMGNYPIFLFDSIPVPGTRIAASHTLGFRIDTPEQIRYDTSRNGLAPIDIDRFNQYLGAFYSYVLENLNRSGLTDADWKRTVSISSGTIGPKIRKLSVNEKDTLMSNGRVALQHYLDSLP